MLRNVPCAGKLAGTSNGSALNHTRTCLGQALLVGARRYRDLVGLSADTAPYSLDQALEFLRRGGAAIALHLKIIGAFRPVENSLASSRLPPS
jgi:hypothetical protein